MARRTFDEALGLRPDLHEPYRDFLGLFWDRRLVHPAVLEACRVRVEQLLGGTSATDRDPGPDEGREPRDRAALALAEQFVLDPHGVTEEHRAAVREHCTEPELVALIEALALFDGFGRFRRAWCDDAGGSDSFEPPPAPGVRLDPPEDADPALTSSVLALQPETMTAFVRLYGTLWSHGTVDQPLKEVARLRNARITDCGY